MATFTLPKNSKIGEGKTYKAPADAKNVKAFKVYRARGADSPGGGYLMDHSRIAYLMDRDGKPISMLPLDQGPKAVAAELEKWTT